jgi:ATP-binding cassette subfamily B protein
MYSFLIFKIDPWLIIFSIIPVLSFIFLEPKLNVLRHDYDMETRTINRQRDYTKRTFYIADYAKEMRLTNIYKLMIKRYRAYSEDIKKVISKYGFRLIAFQMLLYAFFDAIVGQFAPMIYAVAKTLVAGTMLYGDCVVVISSVAGLTSVLLDVVSAVTDFQSNSLDIDEINKYVDHKTEINEGSEQPKTTGDIEFRNVSFTYPNTTEEVITDVSFTINQGEKIALMGYNGSGKSTLIKLMMRLYDPTGGVIRYNGTDIKDYRLSEGSGYRNRFGVQFQDYRLFAMSVRENVLMRECGDTRKDDYLVERSLRLANAYDMVCGFPDGTDSVLTKEFEKEGVVLSGGEAQKIAIARSFAKGGNIVILDEPSASLDPIAEDTLYKNILSSLRGNTVIFISHRVSSAVLADKILLMDKGRLAEAGSHTELMKQNGKYAEMFRMQAENYVEKV